MKNNKKIATCLLLGMMAGMTAKQAAAELYVSPITDDSSINNTQTKSAPLPSATAFVSSSAKSVSAPTVQIAAPLAQPVVTPVATQLSVATPVVINSIAINKPIAMKYGRNVPLFIAMDKIVPHTDGWIVNIDDGLSNKLVSWNGGDDWRGVLSSIASKNGLTIKVNDLEHAVGVSSSSLLAEQMASKSNKVWRLRTDKTLRENLDEWAKKAGWYLKWDESLKIDYPITNSAVLTGDFVGKGGVVDRVIYSLRNQEKPLTAVFYKANNVVLITEAGYKQEGAN
jgi:hypothetical protein